MGYGLHNRVGGVRSSVEASLFTAASRQNFGPTQRPVQWVTWLFLPGVMRLEREAKHPQVGHRLKTHVDINTKENIHTNSAVQTVNIIQNVIFHRPTASLSRFQVRRCYDGTNTGCFKTYVTDFSWVFSTPK